MKVQDTMTESPACCTPNDTMERVVEQVSEPTSEPRSESGAGIRPDATR